MTQWPFAAGTLKVFLRSKKSSPSWRLFGASAGMTAFHLSVFLILLLAAGVHAGDGGLSQHRVVATQPYWTQEVPGRIKALAIVDLDGDDNGEVLVVQESGSVSILSADGTVRPSEPITVPVSPSAPIVISDSTDGISQPWIVLGETILTVDKAGELTPASKSGETTGLAWLNSTQANRIQYRSQAAGFSPMVIGDINGDDIPEILYLDNDGRLVAKSAQGEEVSITDLPEGVTALTLTDGQLLMGTSDRRIHVYDRATGTKAWTSEALCDGTELKSLASGEVSRNEGTDEIVVVGCEGYVEVQKSDGTYLCRTPGWSSPIIQASLINTSAEETEPPTILLMDQEGVALLRLSNWDCSHEKSRLDVIRLGTGSAEGTASVAAVGDVNGDEASEIAIGVGNNVKLYGYGGAELKPRWNRVLQTFESHGGVTAPDFGNVNADSDLEWVVGSEGGYVYAYAPGDSKGVEVYRVGPSPSSGRPWVVHLDNLDQEGFDDIVAVSGRELHAILGPGSLEEKEKSFRNRPADIELNTIIDYSLVELKGDSPNEPNEAVVVTILDDGSVGVTSGEQMLEPLDECTPTAITITYSLSKTQLLPVIYDVDRDDRPEVLISPMEPGGQVLAYSWNQGRYQVMWRANVASDVAQIIPVGLDLDGDSPTWVIVRSEEPRRPTEEVPDAQGALDQPAIPTRAGTIEVLDGRTGTSIWSQPIKGYQVDAVDDLDGDNKPDIVMSTAPKDGEPGTGVSQEIQVLAGETGEMLLLGEVEALSVVATGDVNGDGREEVLAGNDDSAIYVLSLRSDSGTDTKIPTVKLHDGPIQELIAADVDGSSHAAIVAWTPKTRRVHVIQNPGEKDQSSSSYPIEANDVALTKIDLDNDEIFEVFATSDKGSVDLLRLVWNQQPLLVNPLYPKQTTPGHEESYSVEVFDPEDKLKIQLELPDAGYAPGKAPDTPDWPRADYTKVGEGQTIEWSLDRFELWDKGRSSQPKFVAYQDNEVVASLDDLPSIKIEGLKEEYRYALFGLLAALTLTGVRFAYNQRRRDWLASPQGRASQIQKHSELTPRRLLVEIGEIVSQRSSAIEVLRHLDELCQTKPCVPGLADVTRGYSRILEEPESWVNGVGILGRGLAELENVEGQDEALLVCQTLNAASRAHSLATIANLQPCMEATGNLPTPSLPGLLDLTVVLASWVKIAAELAACQQMECTVEKRVAHLEHAAGDLQKLLEDIHAEGAFPEPERSMLGTVTSDWLKTVQDALAPRGQATLLYQRIENSPARLLVEIGDVVDYCGDAPKVLNELHVRCEGERPRCAPGMAEVVHGYTQLLRGRGQWEAGLESMQSGLTALTGVDGQAETLAVCRLLNAAVKANSVARIAALRSQIDAAQSLASASLPGFPDIKALLVTWTSIVDSLESYQKTPSNDEKVRYLGHAITGLSQVGREVRSTLDEPMRSMLDEIVARWLDTVNNALDELRGRAFLQVSMPTQRVLALDNVIVALTLHNEGSAEAQNVRVELLPSEQYEILTASDGVVGAIPAAQSSSVEFHVRPLEDKNFRAEFRISYDDQRRTGRSIDFADQVALVKVGQKYQPIPNPYHAGRPLPTGSPLFFGRDDVFAFIAGKLGGPSLDNVLILIGQRRCGKTSLLKQLPDKMEKRYVPVYIDGQQLGIDPGMANLFYGLSQVIASSLSAAGVEVAAPPRENFEPAPSQVFEQEFLARAEAALGERRLLLAFDEFEEIEARVRDGNVDRAVFPFLRHLMQHSTKVAFMFVGTHKLEELTKDYWSVFFNIAHHKEIRFLDEKAASRLIREPVAGCGLVYDDLAVKRVLEITAGHPYFVQLMCLALVDYANVSKRNFITVEDVRTVVDQTIALGEAHFRWLWDQSGPKEQLVLATLTELQRDEALVTSSAIASRLATPGMSQGWRMDPAEVSDILSRLAGQDVVEEISDHVLQYRFKLEIVNLWIRRNRPLSRVIEDVTVREPFRATEPTTDAGS